MTQEATPVGGEATPVTENPADVFTKLAEQEFGVTDEEEQEQPAEGEEGEQPEAEGADDEAEVEEEADDLPPIEAPVSWDAEAKETFKNLPREVQEIVAKRESDRERFVQQKSQEAAQAKQSAVQQATAELAQIEQAYAQQFQSIAEQIAPQRPNPALLDQQSAHYNPQAFYAQQANYEQAVAQQRELQQQAQQYAQQAHGRAQQIAQAEQAEQHRLIVDSFPEYADPTTGPELQRKLTAVAKRLGYPDELISQARATDILAMREVATVVEKADKYDALMKNKMTKVREARGKPPVTARPGVAQATEQLSARNAQAAFEVARSSKNREVQGAAFFDYLSKAGHLPG